jgi:hypothetical protein
VRQYIFDSPSFSLQVRICREDEQQVRDPVNGVGCKKLGEGRGQMRAPAGRSDKSANRGVAG